MEGLTPRGTQAPGSSGHSQMTMFTHTNISEPHSQSSRCHSLPQKVQSGCPIFAKVINNADILTNMFELFCHKQDSETSAVLIASFHHSICGLNDIQHKHPFPVYFVQRMSSHVK
ncbi:hypothetical protein NP493_212g05014 [Ridgeia piscesae]|uniref:Uncharacterized protein n=1 Tax=Ridgeia piscesae TaxID=27915 RepID=A0AAD9UE73_RIDPI|nr:hypothetical protein NP493_212g05014 [Ridgeia piscesae]